MLGTAFRNNKLNPDIKLIKEYSFVLYYQQYLYMQFKL